MWDDGLCDCTGWPCNFYHQSYRLDWTCQMNQEQSLYSHIPNVEILILDPVMATTLKFLKPLSNLVALSLHAYNFGNDTWPINELVIYATRLTHLNLDWVEEMRSFLSEEFVHTSIRFLSLQIEYSHNRFSPQKILNWAFPSLETFRIRGMLHPENDDYVNDFVSRHIKHLTGLDMEYRLFDGKAGVYIPGHIPSDLWDLCPALTTFGINFLHLSKEVEIYGKERRSHIVSSLELLIHDVFNDIYGSLTERADVLNVVVKRWGINKVIIAEPWDALKVPKQELETFAERLGRKDILIVNCFDIHLQNAIESWPL
ncbi:hypothetical protein CPB86DRAFT_787535 [Serendipita vermifera]|nr:hypothetical protein CPB86DRAFT_787535 [Serendipita vermifera]